MCDVKIGRLGKFDFNPRGELWRKDENRFGHKFLSKFGWSQGKGLGKNENGIAENLKVRIKVGNTGVGWDEKLPIGIDYREYDAVLEDLSKRFQKPNEVKNELISLEKRSQQFKNRIHYQKFVRGKDISRYSEKDMSCIFLSREPEEERESSLKESTISNTENRPSLSTEESITTFNSQLSIADYFALKMKNKPGSSFNKLKESKNCEDVSQPETEMKSKKRKNELACNKKTKQMKQKSESNAVEESLAHKEDFSDNENFLTMRNINKSCKKSKKLLETCKTKQDVNNMQEKYNAVEENSNGNLSLDQLNESYADSPKKSKNIIKSEVLGKKRKKDQKSSKQAKKLCLGKAEINMNVDKNSPQSEYDDAERNCSEECAVKNPKPEQSQKESKRYKNKFSNLKSCLKSCLSNNKYRLKEKNVSFSENISYKMIENMDSDIVLETNEQLLSCSDDDNTDSEIVNEAESIENNLIGDLNSSDKTASRNEQLGNEHIVDSCQKYPENTAMVEDNTVPECFKLPKRSSTNYNSWLETQRIAARMKVYKNMVKKFKKHAVLKKTNLLEIKGYGNWGL